MTLNIDNTSFEQYTYQSFSKNGYNYNNILYELL